MSSFQKLIKYCAIAFAVFLAVTIIGGIASAVFAVVSVVTGLNVAHKETKLIDFSKDFTNVRSINIDHSIGELKITTGETFRVEGINVPDDFEAKVSPNGTLNIYEKKVNFPWFNLGDFNRHNSKIMVYLPENFVAEDTDIECGAGNINIDVLHTKDLKISAGAGNITGNNITAEDEAKLNGGVGNIDLENVNLKDADFDGGVGNIDVEGTLLGDNKIDCGVGDIDLNLQGNKDNYGFEADTGVGSVCINGEKIHDDYNYNSNADNNIKLDGGVGNVNIDFTE